jgi:hypothetical protein
MKVSSQHKVELVCVIPDGLHVESRTDVDAEPPRKVLRIWSTSEVSAADAVTKIIQMSDTLVAALKEAK